MPSAESSGMPDAAPPAPWTDAHAEAIGLACEKLWNGEPPENPIYGPRPHDHPLVVIANQAHAALNAAEALNAAYLQSQCDLAALRSALEALRAERAADSERLAWLERNSARIHVFDPPSGDAWVWEVSATDDDGNFCDPYGEGGTLREAIDAARAVRPATEDATNG